MPYSDFFIEDFSNNEYLLILNDKNQLKKLANNYLNRYSKRKFPLIDGQNLALKESLDHFMLKSFLEDKSIVNNIAFKKYIEYLKYLLEHNPLEMSTNVFLSQDDQVLRELLNTNKFEKYQINRNKVQNKINYLNEKVKSNQDLTQQELDFICSYYGTLRNKTKEYTNLITYIFTNVIERKEIKSSYEIQNAILTYVPFFDFDSASGYDFDSTSIRCLATDIINEEFFKQMGSSLTNKKVILMNRQKFANLNLHTFANSISPYMNQGNDISFYMIVLFHEFTHQVQRYKSTQEQFSDQGLFFTILDILNKSFCDYGRNHDSEDYEIDATFVGWDMCLAFYRQFWFADKKEELLKNCLNNMAATKARVSNSLKKTNTNQLVERGYYNISKINEIIKNNPELLKTYSCLKSIYKEDGTFDYNFFTMSNLASTDAGCMYLEYMLVYDYENFLNFLNNIKNHSDKVNVLTNLFYAIKKNDRNLHLLKQVEKEMIRSEHQKTETLKDTISRLIQKMMMEFINFQALFMQVNKGDLPDYIKSLEVSVIQMCNPSLIITSLDNMDRYEKLESLKAVIDLAIYYKDKKSEEYWKGRMVDVIKKETVVNDLELESKSTEEKII